MLVLRANFRPKIKKIMCTQRVSQALLLIAYKSLTILFVCNTDESYDTYYVTTSFHIDININVVQYQYVFHSVYIMYMKLSLCVLI